MPCKLLLVLLFCLFLSATTRGSDKDTLTSEEKVLLKKGLENFSSRFYFMADSFSRKKDSVQASHWFLKIDPYYLMWTFENPSNPDTIMSRLFLSSSAKRQYREVYANALNAKSELYTTFERMNKEDQEVRWMLEKCDDSLTCANLVKRMRTTDSTHFTFLFNYVNTNGWPTIANGSLYANVIAIHDHEHHEFYIPHMKKAIRNSQTVIQPLNLILHWQSQKMTAAGYQKMLDTADKASFDVSSLLNNELPASLPSIIQAVKKHCPVKLFLMFEAYTPKENEKYIQATNYPYRTNHIIAKLYKELQPQCTKAIAKDVHSLHYKPALHSKPKIMLYVVYDKDIVRRYER